MLLAATATAYLWLRYRGLKEASQTLARAQANLLGVYKARVAKTDGALLRADRAVKALAAENSKLHVENGRLNRSWLTMDEELVEKTEKVYRLGEQLKNQMETIRRYQEKEAKCCKVTKPAKPTKRAKKSRRL